MISSQDLKIDLKNIRHKTIATKYKCPNCLNLNKCLRGNSKELLAKIKINPKQCYCTEEAEIFLYKKNRKSQVPKFEDDKNFIGRLSLHWTGKLWETHSKIKDQFKDKGLGIYLYSLGADWCARRNKPLYSSRLTSLEAQRVWKSKRLRKKYQITKLTNNRWRIIPKEY